MKLRYWLCIWGAMIAFCLITGFATLSSFTSMTAEQALRSMYTCPSILQDGKKTDLTSLSNDSRLIVRCRFTGTRKLRNLCYLSQVKILSVVKGSKKLEGQKIKIFEPVATTNLYIADARSAPGSNYRKLNAIFHFGGKDWFLNSRGQQAAGNGGYSNYAMMAQNVDYLLFLNDQKNPPEKDPPVKEGYILTDSPYSKLEITQTNASTFKVPPEYLWLKDSAAYEIMLRDPKEIQTYFDTKLAILKQLKLV